MIEVINIKKQYNGEPVLKGINFTIQDGDFVSIMGKSGSGKSTLINIIGGFLSPDEGSIKFDGRDISKFSDKDLAEFRSKETGFVFQSFELISTLTAYDNVILPAVLGGMDERKIDENVDMLVEKFGLQEVMNKYPDQMSGGQCQRTAIVRALAFNPKTIILDEPTGAL
ncbi:MAG: ABC transporter ATP-binding protein, partial [Clostridia bacterium]|nr:ABC transporter ATP-binding protein [Clostridia bacterium]